MRRAPPWAVGEAEVIDILLLVFGLAVAAGLGTMLLDRDEP